METILEIGQSKISNKELIDIIDKSDRIYAGPSVPAHGLFLTKVEYPENICIMSSKTKVYNLSFLKAFEIYQVLQIYFVIFNNFQFLDFVVLKV